MIDPKFGEKPQPNPRPPSARGKSVAPLLFGFAAMAGIPLGLGRRRDAWVIELPDGLRMLYKSGSRKGKTKTFSSEEKANRTLKGIIEKYPDACVRKL